MVCRGTVTRHCCPCRVSSPAGQLSFSVSHVSHSWTRTLLAAAAATCRRSPPASAWLHLGLLAAVPCSLLLKPPDRCLLKHLGQECSRSVGAAGPNWEGCDAGVAQSMTRSVLLHTAKASPSKALLVHKCPAKSWLNVPQPHKCLSTAHSTTCGHVACRASLVFPADLTKQERACLHKQAERIGLSSQSEVGSTIRQLA